MKAPRSLKARALQWLSQREQSRVELRRKLLPYALSEAAMRLEEAGAAKADVARAVEVVFPPADTPLSSRSRPAAAVKTEAVMRVEAVLDWLETHRYLSAERFVESRVHARSMRFGNMRIRQELQQHGMALSADAAQALRDSEFERASAVCARKFPEPPADAGERARQIRFLSARGFSPEVVRKAVAAVSGGRRHSRSDIDDGLTDASRDDPSGNPDAAD